MFRSNKTKNDTDQLNQNNRKTNFISTKRTTIVDKIVTQEKKEVKTEKINTNNKFSSKPSKKIQDLIDKFETPCKTNVSANKLQSTSTSSGFFVSKANSINTLKRPTSTLKPIDFTTSPIRRPTFKTISYQPNSGNLNLLNSDTFYNRTWNNNKSSSITQETNKNRTHKGKAGVLYIIHHDEFKKSWIPFKKSLPLREGSKRDVEALEKAFTKFNLTIKKHENMKKDDIKTLMNQIEKENFSNNSCVVFAILSHGGRNNMIYSSDGKKYSIFDSIIFNLINNPTLKGKPKIFLVQACKGPVDPRFYDTDCPRRVKGIPDELIILFASTEGFVSFRCTGGSPLIQQFCLELEENGKFTDIQTIMSNTTKRVIELTGSKQIPCPSGLLTTPYVFGKYI